MSSRTPLDTVRQIATNPVINECLWLVKNNIPFDVAFSLDPDTRTAFSIVFAKFEGAEFDWNTGRYKDRS